MTKDLQVRQIEADQKFISTESVPAHLEISADPYEIILNDLDQLDSELNRSTHLETSLVGQPPSDTETETDGSETDVSSIELGVKFYFGAHYQKDVSFKIILEKSETEAEYIIIESESRVR